MHWQNLFKETNDFMMSENAIFSHLMANGINFTSAGEIPFKSRDGFYFCKPVSQPVDDTQRFLNEKLRSKANGYSCNEIASLSGLNQSNVSTWTRGKDLGIYSLEKIAKGFGFNVFIEIKKG